MHHPKTIEKRLFTCNNCGYSVQVYGESYFDLGCQNYVATFQCNDCHILFEGLLTRIEEWDTGVDFIYDLNNEINCFSCGGSKTVLWNKDIGSCPKCNEIIPYKINGKITLK